MRVNRSLALRSLRCNGSHCGRARGQTAAQARGHALRATSLPGAPMFTRSTLPMLAAAVLLAWGSCAGAEAYDPHAAAARLDGAPNQTAVIELRAARRPRRRCAASGRTPSNRGRRHPRHCAPSPRVGLAPDSGARAGGRLTFNRTPDDVRAGTSSASITLGRLNLNEPRAGAALGGISLATSTASSLNCATASIGCGWCRRCRWACASSSERGARQPHASPACAAAGA